MRCRYLLENAGSSFMYISRVDNWKRDMSEYFMIVDISDFPNFPLEIGDVVKN